MNDGREQPILRPQDSDLETQFCTAIPQTGLVLPDDEGGHGSGSLFKGACQRLFYTISP